MQPIPIPEIYVLWHPQCPLGEKIARRILAWLRPGNGLGPEVFYRSLPAPEAPIAGLPPPLPGEPRAVAGTESVKGRQRVSNLHIVLPLIDENMVADIAWRHWLEQLTLTSTSGVRRTVIPIALDATAYNMPPCVRELNYLRPAGLPLPSNEGTDEAGFEGAILSLLKQVTEALCRVLLPRGTGRPLQSRPSVSTEPLPKVNVFLSHAKQDGTVPARRIRDYIYSQTQLAAFYDENDIAFGAVFSKIIQEDLDSPNTAALIAIRSARYASRPWCRREFSLFRRPRKENSSAGTAERWRIYPSLVVEAMEGRQLSSGVPEMGNSSMIRWSDDDHNLEELVVTTVIRDAMLASFHSAMGASIPSTPNQIIINWLPDPTTLLHIPSVREGGERDILYPGRGLSGLELDILSELFPCLTFRSFEEVLS
jgi:hypothetical protein